MTDDNETPSDLSDDFLPDPILDGTFNAGDTDKDGHWDVGEVWYYAAFTTVTAGQHRNVGTVTATAPDQNGNPTGNEVTDTDPAHWFGNYNAAGYGWFVDATPNVQRFVISGEFCHTSQRRSCWVFFEAVRSAVRPTGVLTEP